MYLDQWHHISKEMCLYKGFLPNFKVVFESQYEHKHCFCGDLNCT